MVLRTLIGRLLAIFLIVGLVAAPLVTPAASKSMSGPEMASGDAGMPCCPDEPQSNPCPDCPLVAICIFKVAIEGPSSADAVPLRVASRTSHVVRNDESSRDHDRPPPDHPPRA